MRVPDVRSTCGVRMSKCKRKPQYYEFLQWSGHNVDQMMGFCKGKVCNVYEMSYGFTMTVYTKFGYIELRAGDYVLKDEKGNLRVCKPELFGALYEIEEE